MIELLPSTMKDAAALASMETADDTAEFIFGWDEDRHREEMKKADVHYLSIVHNNELSGFIIMALEPDGNTVEFRRIVVLRKGEGIGQEAIAAMEQYCLKELRRTEIWLDVMETNTRGRHIYEKLGYEQFKKGEQAGKPLLFYRKRLNRG